MKLEECTTVKECLMWAEERWPTFWDFATHQPMTKIELTKLEKRIKNDSMFSTFLDKFQDCIPSKENLDEETKKYLKLGATALRRIQ